MARKPRESDRDPVQALSQPHTPGEFLPAPGGSLPAEPGESGVAPAPSRRSAGPAPHQTAAAMYLCGSSAGTFPKVETAAYSRYVQKLREDAGDPDDPVEQMLVEQLALAHHAVGRLHLKAATAETVEAAGVFLAAAARLMAEHRKTTLALKTYREPAAVPQVMVVQKNGAGGEQKIAVVTGADLPGPRRLDRHPDTELVGEAGESSHDRAHRVA